LSCSLGLSFLQGTFGGVFVCTIKDGKTPAQRFVARKVERTSEDWQSYIALLSSIQHDNVITLFGVIADDRVPSIITSYSEQGTLMKAMRKLALTVEQKLTVVSDIAAGIEFLNSVDYTHKALTSGNVLLDAIGHCKITGFADRRLPMDTYRWRAPEELTMFMWSEAGNVWSAAILCHEVFSDGCLPWREVNRSKLVETVNSGMRMTQPERCPDFVFALMLRAWHADPAQRWERRRERRGQRGRRGRRRRGRETRKGGRI
jgi:serine/threonine protein kinase